jgi:hypothetical protein
MRLENILGEKTVGKKAKKSYELYLSFIPDDVKFPYFNKQ